MNNETMNNETMNKILLFVLGVLGIGASVYIFTDGNRTKKALPPEYWLAESERHKASSEIKRLELESEERLEMDKRDRQAEENTKRRAFEQTAPAGYWALQAEKERAKGQLAVAKEESKAQLGAAKEQRRTLENTMYEQRKMQENLMKKFVE